MQATRELVAGGGTFVLFLVAAGFLAVFASTAALRGFSLIFGLGAGGACGVFAALIAHLTRNPGAHYEPIEGDAGAWGLTEYDERTRGP